MLEKAFGKFTEQTLDKRPAMPFDVCNFVLDMRARQTLPGRANSASATTRPASSLVQSIGMNR